MKVSHINIRNTRYFPQIILDYLDGKQEFRPFYQYLPSMESFHGAVAIKEKHPVQRELLTQILTEQYVSAGINLTDFEKVNQNIAFLNDEKTFTVTTGHQLCLFTGPLYFIYKIISTIRLACELNDYFENRKGYHFIPVFWMVSEDHDFEEINHIRIFGKNLEWKKFFTGNPPAGKIKTKNIEPLLNEFELLIGNFPDSRHLTDVFRKSYLQHENLAGATRYLVHELFRDYGLVIIDGNDNRFKEQFIQVMRDDIYKNIPYRLISRTNEKLDAMSLKAQINPREINCFYMTDEMRERISMEDNVFNVLNTDISFTKDELEDDLKNHPEHYSPNVALRPLFQEMVIPNVAYVGGPNELAYWLQMKDLFDYYHISLPVLVPRLSALWIDRSACDKMKKFGFSGEDIFIKEDELIKKFLLENSRTALQTAEEENQIASAFESLSAKGESVDKSLSGLISAEKQKALKSIKIIEEKLFRAEKRKSEETVNQIKKLKRKLFPPDGSGLQERYENFIPYYLTTRDKFFNILLENFNAFDGNIKVFMES